MLKHSSNVGINLIKKYYQYNLEQMVNSANIFLKDINITLKATYHKETTLRYIIMYFVSNSQGNKSRTKTKKIVQL